MFSLIIDCVRLYFYYFKSSAKRSGGGALLYGTLRSHGGIPQLRLDRALGNITCLCLFALDQLLVLVFVRFGASSLA